MARMAPTLAGPRARTARALAYAPELARVARARLARGATRLGLTRSGAGALLAGAFLWLIARIVAGDAVYLVAYGLIGLVVIGRAVAPRRVTLDARRLGLDARLMEGDAGFVDLEIEARRRTSLVVIEEQMDPRLGPTVSVPVDGLRPGEPWLHRYRVRAHRRGEFVVGPLLAVTTDPLDLARHTHPLADATTVIVHPRVEQISTRLLTRQLEDPPVRPPVSQPWPSGLEFHGMREYVPGDDLRRVVWRASARTGRIMVREAEQGVTDRVTIVLDTAASHHSPPAEGTSESFETSVRCAASLTVHYLNRGLEVTVTTGDGNLTRPLRGTRTQIEALDALARLEPGREGVGASLARIGAGGMHNDHIIVITPVFDPSAAGALSGVVRRGTSALLILVEQPGGAGAGDAPAVRGCQALTLAPHQSLADALAGAVGPGMGR